MPASLAATASQSWLQDVPVLGQVAEVWQQIGAIHLFKLGGTQLTLDNLIIGIIMLVLSFRAAHFITYLFERRLVRRLTDDINMQATYRRVLFYVMAALCVMLSLSVAGIPLTVFTVLGGAIAIGVGFGSQNIMNNFISGLILMLEKPMRIGDTVEIDGVVGCISSIGARSTHLTTIDEKTHIIPNSFFLEKGFLNWSLSNNQLRSEVKVNVAYGVNTQQVKDIIEQVVKQNSQILAEPPAQVLFSNFADSALEFTVYFWLNMATTSPAVLRSDLRFAIDQALRKHQIEIPFPQRTLNFASGVTIPVSIKTER